MFSPASVLIFTFDDLAHHAHHCSVHTTHSTHIPTTTTSTNPTSFLLEAQAPLQYQNPAWPSCIDSAKAAEYKYQQPTSQVTVLFAHVGDVCEALPFTFFSFCFERVGWSWCVVYENVDNKKMLKMWCVDNIFLSRSKVGNSDATASSPPRLPLR